MGTFIGSMITIFVVSLVLRLLSKEKLDKKTSSIYKFTVRAGSFLAAIGVFGAVFFIAMMVLGYFTGERCWKRKRHIFTRLSDLFTTILASR